MKDISITPLGVIEGISAKTQKPFKFWRYLLPSGKVASCSEELKANDSVAITQSGDYWNLTKATGAAFVVKVNGE